MSSRKQIKKMSLTRGTIYEKHRTERLYQSVMDVVVRANEERFMVSDMSDMCEALEEILDKRAEIKAKKMAEKMAEKLAEEKAQKMAEEKVRKLTEEKLQKLTEKRIEEQKRLAESRGMEQGLLALIKKKIGKGKSVAQIADELEETEEVILPLYNRLKAEKRKEELA